jgi:S1-C subfamily serine protease
MIASHTGADDVAFAWLVSKRSFTGNWEYMLDEALWTSPPTMNWSGAGLIDRDGKLVGIGSLIVRDATGEDPRLPGNLFVPIDALKTILADLVAEGHRKGPSRPWLGVAADEVQGRLVVSRVSPGGPADEAGVEVGDIILGVAGEPVRTQVDFYTKLWSGRNAGSSVPLRLLQGADVRELSVRSIDRVEYFRPRTMH